MNQIFIRPWGYYETLAKEQNYKVKKIVINPGQKLSLQSHQYRSEHWIIIKGKAQITNGDQVLFLASGQSTFVSKNQLHRIENLDIEELYLIEVQIGYYLEEDDIIRYEDIYGRDLAKPSNLT